MASSDDPHRWGKLSSELHADCRIFDVYKSHFHHAIRQTDGEFLTINAPEWLRMNFSTP